MQESLIHLRRTQLHSFNYGLGLEEPAYDIAHDLTCTQMLLGEYPTLLPTKRSPTSVGFMAKVQVAMSLDTLDDVPVPSQQLFEGVHDTNIQDLSLRT